MNANILLNSFYELGKSDKMRGWRLESGLSPPVKYFADRSKAVLLSLVDLLCYFCLVSVMNLRASVYLCLVVTCWERADLLALVCGA